MSERFSRAELLLGAAAMTRLSNSHAAVFGLGGVGAAAAEALARAGVGALTLVDSDTVSLTNINRQLFALTGTVGRLKAEVAAERLGEINPALRLTVRSCFFSEETAASFDFSQYDYVLDAIDTVTSKLLLVERCRAADTPLICCLGTGNKLDPTRFRVSDIYETSVCPLARVLRAELRRRGVPALRVVWSDEPPLVPVPAGDAEAPG
ncbi:MAG: tRNA threonylcarbamoyladenosine dehydratase, partial [Oscillospiraceae bacterium]